MHLHQKIRKAALGSAAAALALGGVVGVSTVTAAPASAMVCGYSEEIEDYDSTFAINVPVVGSISPFSGQRQVAHYGNCGNGNVKIKVTMKGGSKNYCVQPGDVRLGFTENDKQISGASKIGSC